MPVPIRSSGERIEAIKSRSDEVIKMAKELIAMARDKIEHARKLHGARRDDGL
jgi:hypothetical protein